MMPDIISLLFAVVVVALLPFAAMVVTSYTKIVVVLGLLRNAIGVQQVPPNMVLNAIAMIITCFIMAPVGMEAAKQASGKSGEPGIVAMLDGAREPFRQFLDKHTQEREKAFFLHSAKQLWSEEAVAGLQTDDLIVLAPAFTLSQLTEAFKIGFLLYLVFVVIDLVIANVLMAMGLSQVPPTNIAIPFKLLLFVVLDGWSALIHGLILTYR